MYLISHHFKPYIYIYIYILKYIYIHINIYILDCAATYPNAFICYKASSMVLHVDSGVAYLTMPEARTEARSCYDGNFYLRNRPSPRPLKPTPKRNGLIHP